MVYKYNFNKGDYNAIRTRSALNEIKFNRDTVFDSKGTLELECYEYFNDKINELMIVTYHKRNVK